MRGRLDAASPGLCGLGTEPPCRTPSLGPHWSRLAFSSSPSPSSTRLRLVFRHLTARFAFRDLLVQISNSSVAVETRAAVCFYPCRRQR